MKAFMKIAFLGLYVALVAWLHGIDVWNEHFQETGALLLFYNLGRVVFLGYLAWIMYALGEECLAWLARRKGGTHEFEYDGGLDRFLMTSFTGASVTVLAMLVLGFLNLYYFPVMVVLSGAILFRSCDRFAEVASASASCARNLRAKLTFDGRPATAASHWTGFLLIVLAIEFAIVVVNKGVFPDIFGLGDSFGHYLPYYRQVLQDHHIWMNVYFGHYYTEKGSGLHFLAMILTDIQGGQLVSCYYLMLSAALLIKVMNRITGAGMAWGLLAAIVLLATEVLDDGFIKLHVVVGAHVLFIGYAATLPFSDAERRRPAIPALVLGMAALVASGTIYVYFAGPLLLFEAGFSALRKQRARVRKLLVMAALMGGFCGIMLCWNYVTSGMWEYTPVAFFLKHRNDELLRRWIDPVNILLAVTSAQYQQDFSTSGISDGIAKLSLFSPLPFLRDRSFLHFPFNEAAFVLLLLCLVQRSLKTTRELTEFILPSLLTAYMIVLLGLIFPVGTTTRYFSFLYPMKAGLYTYFFFLGSRGVVWVLGKMKFRFPVLLTIAFMAWPLWTTAASLVQRQKGKAELASFRFLAGQESYLEAYAENPHNDLLKTCFEVSRHVEAGARIGALNFVPECYGLPGPPFERPEMAVFSPVMSTVAFGAPAEAMAALKKYGVNYFWVTFTRPVLVLGLSPLFEPESVGRNFTIIGSTPDSFLLTWRKAGDPEIPAPWLESLAELRKQSFKQTWGEIHERTKKNMGDF